MTQKTCNFTMVQWEWLFAAKEVLFMGENGLCGSKVNFRYIKGSKVQFCGKRRHQIRLGETSPHHVVSYLALSIRIEWNPPLIRLQYLINLIALPYGCYFYLFLACQIKPFIFITGTLQRTRGHNHISFIQTVLAQLPPLIH